MNQQKLKKFKAIFNSKYASRFKSVDDLKQLVIRAVNKQLEETTNTSTKTVQQPETDYKSEAEIYKKFLLLPERYSGREVFLRIRLSGKFGTWMVKDELFTARGLNRGDTIFCNDGVYVPSVIFWELIWMGLRLTFLQREMPQIGYSRIMFQLAQYLKVLSN